jgi:hypothetical protein
MAKIFLDQLARMIHRATSGRIDGVSVECRHFFSGAAVYANGRICASLTPAGFAIKLPKESRDVLRKRRGVKPYLMPDKQAGYMTATVFRIASALRPLHAGGVHIWLAERGELELLVPIL